MMAITTKNQGAPKAKTRTEVTVNTQWPRESPRPFLMPAPAVSLPPGHSSYRTCQVRDKASLGKRFL